MIIIKFRRVGVRCGIVWQGLKMDIRQIHECEKSEGKIVAIELDAIGNTYCAYCHKKEKMELEIKLNKHYREKIATGEITFSKAMNEIERILKKSGQWKYVQKNLR
jgi:hypothetical protein